MLKNKGFTIVEAIIVTAVLAAVTVMAFPNFVSFFKMQEEIQEDTAMAEIKQALEAYADDKKELPANATWAADLAPYTSLSVNAITNDSWGRPRQYKKITDGINFRSANINVDYAVVYSHGVDPGEGDTGVDYDLDLSFLAVNDYNVLQPAFGDKVVKYTNYTQQIKNYGVTDQRLKDISSVLANYATSMFNEVLVGGGVANPEQFIYYPPSANSGGIGLYAAAVVGQLDGITGGVNSSISVGTGTPADEAARKDDMKDLMRLLGLPDSHCCSALNPAEPAFFYYSNPMPRLGGAGCGGRPTALERKLPPRVTVDPDLCG